MKEFQRKNVTSKFTTIRLTVSGERFEILVDPDNALKFKQGEITDHNKAIAFDEIYEDANKGTRISENKLKKHIKTTNIQEALKIILEKGELLLNTQQRKQKIEEKRNKIIGIITRNYVDPKTKIPHPPQRIELALQEARVSIDPIKNADEQINIIIDELRKIIPMKSENHKLKINIPAQFAPQSIGLLKKLSEIESETWQTDGSLTSVVNVTPGSKITLIDKLNSLTKGNIIAEEIE
ncbi:MAG: ribosome assembly factor SBDS [Thaumarchaeota archaeon]|mgnify:FL=1|jgi:ribosome maturation protein SDO1|nr:ribosome assembly factor SBDS [Nitrososphaerota archaeon]|tara:strand:+ start:4025 stop:4738 length:714 start_codon:yes stop_codon:yes gene_type:complete